MIVICQVETEIPNPSITDPQYPFKRIRSSVSVQATSFLKDPGRTADPSSLLKNPRSPHPAGVSGHLISIEYQTIWEALWDATSG